jgi:hypothetical protein
MNHLRIILRKSVQGKAVEMPYRDYPVGTVDEQAKVASGGPLAVRASARGGLPNSGKLTEVNQQENI